MVGVSSEHDAVVGFRPLAVPYMFHTYTIHTLLFYNAILHHEYWIGRNMKEYTLVAYFIVGKTIFLLDNKSSLLKQITTWQYHIFYAQNRYKWQYFPSNNYYNTSRVTAYVFKEGSENDTGCVSFYKNKSLLERNCHIKLLSICELIKYEELYTGRPLKMS